jgi:hypothetical protein
LKKLTLSAAALALAVFAAPVAAHAQVSTILKPVRLGVALGGSFPLSDFGQVVNTGYNATALLALQPPGIPLGFRIEGAFNQFGFKNGTTCPQLTTCPANNGNANIFAVTGDALFNVMGGPDLSPYIIGGVGYYHESLSGTNLGGNAENHFGFNVGAGINIPLTGFATFIEARYNRVSENGTSTSFIPVTVGILF